MTIHYFEDFAVGQRYGGATTVRVEPAEITEFAARFDPQPFHLGEESARATIFEGLAASGWHTAAMTMRLIVDSDLKPAGGVIGGGGDAILWPRPVRPHDVLTVESEIMAVRASKSRPELGLVKVKCTTSNQRGEAVQIFTANLLVPRRPA